MHRVPSLCFYTVPYLCILSLIFYLFSVCMCDFMFELLPLVCVLMCLVCVHTSTVVSSCLDMRVSVLLSVLLLLCQCVPMLL